MRQDELTQFRDGKIVLSDEPLVLETPVENLEGFITPTKLFFVWTHFQIPKIDKNKWPLRIEGESNNLSRSISTSYSRSNQEVSR